MVYVWISVGVLIGSVLSNIIFYYRASSGIFRIDHSDPEKDVYRFEIGDLDELDKKKRLILKIDHNADLSQN